MSKNKNFKSLACGLFLSLCFLVFLALLTPPLKAQGLGETVSIAPDGVFLSEGYGGPLPSSLQISQLGTLFTQGFNQASQLLGFLLEELSKKSLDSEALLKGIGEYFKAHEVLLKDLQKNYLTQLQAFKFKEDNLFGSTPFSCSDSLTAQALKEAKKSMRYYSKNLKATHASKGEGTQNTEVSAEKAVAAILLKIMQEGMSNGTIDEEKVPSSSSMFPFSGVITKDGGRAYQAIISAINSEPTPIIRHSSSFAGQRALELQGIKMGRIAGIQEGLQIAFDLQNAVINGQPFSQMQQEANAEAEAASLKNDEYIEGGANDTSVAISILQALTHQFERARLANPDWYAKIDHGSMTTQGLLRELLKIEAWRGYMETQLLRIGMVNAYNLAQQTAILMEKHDNARMINLVYPGGESKANN
ncbi:MAG: hypothetical protein IJU40_03560 [Desulfovibrionaceae bacterium]|nr:hypothetical protein [Desulfovibrionaceae bacterium]